MGANIFIAVDPGQTTGWAIFDVRGSLLQVGELVTFEDLKWLTESRIAHLEHIICERVVARSASFNQFAIEVMGALHYIADVNRVPITFQPPSALRAPRSWPTVKLDVFKSQHIQDAVAHGLVFFKRTVFPEPRDPCQSSR